jgi:predicted nucleotidyltransferase component of viral defense system
MLSLKEIKTFYPESLHPFERFILREYLQYNILEIIFESPFAGKLAFLGGTCLRIIHANSRFSADLDFDNFNLSEEDFKGISGTVKTELEKLGYEVEIRNVMKGAYHCYIRFPELLYQQELSGNKEQRILIQLNTEAHDFSYQPEKPILNKFDVFTQVFSTPEELLLAQKFYAIINRKRNKGRDFFDVAFLLGRGIKPNYEYLNLKLGIRTSGDLQKQTLEKCAAIDMSEMAKDIEPFLFNPKDTKKVLLFPELLKQADL